MYKCDQCEASFETPNKIASHKRWHHKKDKDYICEKCEKIFKDNSSYVIHSKYCTGKKKIDRTCPKCGYHIKTCYDRHVNSCTGNGPRRRKIRHPGGRYWLTGMTYEEGYGKDVAKIMKEKMSQKLKGNHNWDKLSEEAKEYNKNRARESILKRYNQGWLPKSGRCKKITYESKFDGAVKLDGSWELCVAIYLDDKNINWNRNKNRFKYINLKNKESNYTPDFFIKEWDSYLEVKGYETKLDLCKWGQFKCPLIVWKKSDINKIKNYIKENKHCMEIYHKYYTKFM